MSELKYAYFQTELERWSDIFRINHRFFSRFVFRGQSDSNWGLESSLERQIKKFYPPDFDPVAIAVEEEKMLKEFKWKYPLYSRNSPAENDLVEWLTIMQHYRAPTRLLDFSYSIFIALSFAIEFNNAASSAVWAINTSPIRSRSFEHYRNVNKLTRIEDDLDAYTLKMANEDLKDSFLNSNGELRLHLIKPKHINKRLSRQQGLFLMPSNIQRPFNSHIKSFLSNEIPVEAKFKDLIDYSDQIAFKQDDISLIKIIIPRKLTFEIAKALRAMNLTAEHLFPGLEGLARSLAYPTYE